MPQVRRSDFIETTAAKFKIPGVAVGVRADGKESYAYHGVHTRFGHEDLYSERADVPGRQLQSRAGSAGGSVRS